MSRYIDKLIVHCSDSPDSRDAVDAETIRSWHLERGFSDIGYHFVIKRNGILEFGRPVERVGAHCKGYNYGSIGVCLVGMDTFTPAQFNALQALYDYLKQVYSGMNIYGHRDFNKHKTCPNFKVSEKIV